MRRREPLSALVLGVLLVAGLCTLVMDGGWWVWVPVGLALAVFARLWFVAQRR